MMYPCQSILQSCVVAFSALNMMFLLKLNSVCAIRSLGCITPHGTDSATTVNASSLSVSNMFNLHLGSDLPTAYGLL